MATFSRSRKTCLRVGTGISWPCGVFCVGWSAFCLSSAMREAYRMNRLVPRLEGVDAKIQRAKRHLATVKREVRAYKGSHPEVVEAKLDPSIPGYRLYAKIRPPRIGISVIIGDFLFDLRSALDHLARGLVETEGNVPVDTGTPRTMFPVFDKQPKKLIVAGGVDPNALAIVERLQPYQRPDWWLSELWILNELHNIDKHRTLHLPTAAWVGRGTQVAVLEPGRRHVAVILGRVESGAELGHIPIHHANPSLDPEVEVYGQFTVEVFMPPFGPQASHGLPLLDGLQALFDFVSKDVVPLFDPFFQ